MWEDPEFKVNLGLRVRGYFWKGGERRRREERRGKKRITRRNTR